jgi:hypothetical protein
MSAMFVVASNLFTGMLVLMIIGIVAYVYSVLH